MPDTTEKNNSLQQESLRHRGRGSQIWIYLGKFLRMFVYQNDWKVLPMAAVIAGLLALVIRDSFFLTMEGTLMGAFTLTCVGIWNGCFNSIQVICRERDVIKREHRSGMHISSYVIAHLIYQAILCLLQTIITVYIFWLVGIKFPEKGLFFPWMIVDIGITVFIVTYASDALSLWISTLVKNTTAAMTIMPFVLIFQLVFSGGMLSLPEWSKPITNLTISHYGLTALTSQADYNDLPMVSLWWTLVGMRDSDLTASVTVGEALDYLSDERNPGVKDLREMHYSNHTTVRELLKAVSSADVDDTLKEFLNNEEMLSGWGDEEIDISFTVGDIVDRLSNDEFVRSERDRRLTVNASIGQIIDTIGQDKVYQAIQDTAGVARRNADYEYSRVNIASSWSILIFITLGCALLSIVTLEFIDRDKR